MLAKNRNNLNRRPLRPAVGAPARPSYQGSSRNVRTVSKLKQRVRKRRAAGTTAVKGAQNRLKNFRQASILAVAITGFILLMFAPGEAGLAQDTATEVAVVTDTVIIADGGDADSGATNAQVEEEVVGPQSTRESAGEALGALQNLWNSFIYYLPKLLIALGTLVLAWFVTKLLRVVLQKTMGRWNSSSAIISLASIAVWLLAVGVALSVVAGDIRALVGSLGLIGLALSWSLQTPIESFTGWLLNSFQGYYRVGDRIRVGEVFGDVYRIDFLTTTVWEIGAPYQPGFVHAEQPTGRLVTFPNNEIVTGTVINLTGDFPFVWDELSVGVANESDMSLAMQVLEQIALDLLGSYMVEPARQYAKLLTRAGLGDSVSEKPQVFISMDDSWTNITIRYLVGARERRKWKSELTLRITKELNKPQYLTKIIPVYPRQQVQVIDPSGIPVAVASIGRQGSGEETA